MRRHTPEMRFIGLDLAWAGKHPSGLAALDEGGSVVGESLGTSDDEIAAFIGEHDHGGAVLAIDAPLVVDNPTGRRD
jgi:predicted RNase H-like nuclease